MTLNVATLSRVAARKARSAGRRVRWRLIEALEPRRAVEARGLRLTLQCDNWITQFRMDTLETKEPETLDWIDTHVRDSDVFFDVGGNIGTLALYAALRHPRARVVVFEPEYSNLHLLRDNIVANGLADRILTYPIALGDRTGLSWLRVQDLTPGAALHSESPTPRQTTDTGQAVVLSEGTWAMRMDEFCEQSGLWPNAVEIDVDGAEARVLAGAAQVLASPSLRSLLVEAGDAGLPPDALNRLAHAGFSKVPLAHPSEGGNEVWAR